MVDAFFACYTMEEPSPVEATECCHSRCDTLTMLYHVEHSGLRILIETPCSLSLNASRLLDGGNDLTLCCQTVVVDVVRPINLLDESRSHFSHLILNNIFDFSFG